MKILWLRKQKGMSQRELAETSGTLQQQIALIESGRSDPRLSTLWKIAKAFETDIAGLFFTLENFIKQVNGVVKEQFPSKTPSLKALNKYCGEHSFLSPFDPNWEKVCFDKNRKLLISKEKKS